MSDSEKKEQIEVRIDMTADDAVNLVRDTWAQLRATKDVGAVFGAMPEDGLHKLHAAAMTVSAVAQALYEDARQALRVYHGKELTGVQVTGRDKTGQEMTIGSSSTEGDAAASQGALLAQLFGGKKPPSQAA